MYITIKVILLNDLIQGYKLDNLNLFVIKT